MPASNQLLDSTAVVAEVTAGTWAWVSTDPGLAGNLVWDWAAFIAYVAGGTAPTPTNLCPDFAAVSAWATTPPPAAPTGASVGTPTITSLTVSWSWSGLSLTGFKVYRNSTNTFGSATLVHTGTSTSERSWADSGLTGATTYYYWVVAYGPGGPSSADSAGSGTTSTPPPAPAAPSSAGVGSATTSGLTVSWAWSGSNLTGFKVYRGTSSSFGAATLVHTGTSTSESSWADTGLAGGTTFWYWVSAYGPGGESTATSAGSDTTLVAAPSTAPTGVTVAAGSGGTSAAVSWTWGGGAVGGFRVYRDRNGAGSTLLFSTTGSGTTYSDVGVSDGDTVAYVIAAYTTGGDGPSSSSSSTFTVVFYPAAPTALVSTGNTTTTEGLSWSYSGVTVTGFKIYRDGSLVATQAGTGTTYTDTGLTTGTSYSWVVTAYRTGAPDSGNSNTLSDTTSSGTLTAPSGLTVTDGSFVSGGTEHFIINYSWTAGDVTATTRAQFVKEPGTTFGGDQTDPAGVTSDSKSLGTTPTLGGDYDVRIRHEKTGWTPSAWVEVDTTSIG